MTRLDVLVRWSAAALLVASCVGCGPEARDSNPEPGTNAGAVDVGRHSVTDVEHGAEPESPQDPNPVSEASVPALPLTIAELAATDDAIAAFDGKRVEVTGRVARPGRVDPVSESMIVLVSEDGFGPSVPFDLAVHAHFPLPARSELRMLAPARQVTLRGEIRNVSAKVWELHDAELIATEPSEPAAMTAVELTREFIEDRGEAFMQEHDARLLEVTGTVTSESAIVDRLLAVSLAGADRDGESTEVLVLIEPEHFGAVGEPLPDANDLSKRDIFPAGTKATFHGHVLLFELTELVPGHPPAVGLLGYPTAWPVSLERPTAPLPPTN